MTAQEILKMIEEVDPADTAKLDEIDVLVFCYTQNLTFLRMETDYRDVGPSWVDWPVIFTKEQGRIKWDFPSRIRHTRSRDALKAIRPEGWGFNNYYHYKGGVDSQLHSCSAGNWKVNYWENTIFAEALPTEELAELHAIIQAIEYERSQK